ncbi:MAG TPA: amino acid ABC transporter permease [Ilumatobacteraceae bacterium]|nr:amino acid ABC transporter permease [Ilumatobacteraceae bacterium]
MSDRPTRRERYERARRRRSVVIATVSTVAVVGAMIVLIPLTPGWERVRQAFFDGDVFVETFPGLVEAFWLDVQILLWSTPFILVVSLLVALARNTRGPALFPLRAFAVIYTDVLRGIPVILLVYLIGFGVPALGLSRTWSNPLIWGTVTLVLSYSAYTAEIIRAGIDAVHESQRAGARSLGMTSSQTMRSIVLPQAFRKIVPPMMNTFVSLQKDVALVSLIGPVEILRQAGIDKAIYANFTPYVAASLIFLALTIPCTRLADWLLARQRARTGATTIA